jgi:Tannase and feruloyl esterase
MSADSLKQSFQAQFAPGDLTTIVVVRRFAKGDPLVLSEPVTDQTARARADLLLVKLIVGPGNPGPADAPSTSPGIGIEVWLPAADAWDGRVHAFGGNGWSGGNAGSPNFIANSMGAADIAALEGSVTSTCDSGHGGQRADLGGVASSNGDFAMQPDGSIALAQWRDFSSRSVHEQAVKTKALAAFYYGKPPHHAYFEGLSQGGRQGHMLAQRFPDDYDGIVANMPALYWTDFIIAGTYNDLLAERELGGVQLTPEQMDLVSSAAIRSCDEVGGVHLGYVMDYADCRYDPTLDPDVLCPSDGGRSTSPHCVTKAQAEVMKRMWYGMTSDGSAPPPAEDNGWGTPLGGVRRWYGRPPGTSLYNAFVLRLFGIRMPSMGTDMVALALQDPTMAPTGFRNATGNGADKWKTRSYQQLAEAIDRGHALQPEFDFIDTADPDLSAFKARGGKLLTWHGLNDEAIPVQGTIRYYEQVIATMGGVEAVQAFYRLYLVPGIGHGGANGTCNPDVSPPTVPWGYFYRLMIDWAEKGIAPGRIHIESAPDAAVRIAQPIAPYPGKARYVGGDPRVAASFVVG